VTGSGRDDAGRRGIRGARNFYNLVQSVNDIYGFKYVVPTHQGRAAEHITVADPDQAGAVRPDEHVLYDHPRTCRARRRHLLRLHHRERTISDSPHPFKGNVD